MDDAFLDHCANCNRTALHIDKPLKPCAKCKGRVYYCSRECQNLHWKRHKKECGKPRSSSSSAPPKSPESPPFIQQRHPYPFQALSKRQWLSNRPQIDVYKLLYDSFRLRLEDNFMINDEVEVGSVYHNDNEHSLEAFENGFLRMTCERGLAPEWLHGNKINACLLHGMTSGLDRSKWGGLTTKATAADIVEWYEDDSMPLQMRIFAEQVYGDDPSGQAKDLRLRAQFMTRAGQQGPNRKG